MEVISEAQINNRSCWIDEISKLSGDFGADSDKVKEEMAQEITTNGIDTLIGHLRLCGAIPEQYDHDSSEEKLYSKYTDIVLSESYEAIGLTSLVLTERADAADVECVAKDYSFVADAKAFRLSRTAKNQKDFKVEAMNGWKKGKPYAMVVCPTAKNKIIDLCAIMKNMKAYSEDLRQKIVQSLQQGNSKSQAARLFNVSLSSVKRYARIAQRGGSLKPGKGSGRPPKVGKNEERLLQEDVRERPTATIHERRMFLENITGKALSDPTIRRLLKRMGFPQKNGQWGRWSETNG